MKCRVIGTPFLGKISAPRIFPARHHRQPKYHADNIEWCDKEKSSSSWHARKQDARLMPALLAGNVASFEASPFVDITAFICRISA